MLELDQFSAFHGSFQAAVDVSLKISPGETLSMVGANGAGKSSLLTSIAGLTEGRGGLRLGGRDLSSLAAQDRAQAGIALAPEGRRMFNSLTAAENLAMGGRIGRPGRWTQAAVLSLFPGLESCLDRSAGLLSGGQQQMVAIGRALMANPALLLLDEVSLGLAPLVVDEVYTALADLRSGEMAVILVEQDLSRALSNSDRFLCLLKGHVAMEGQSAGADVAALGRAFFGEDA